MKYVSELKELSGKVFDSVEDLEKAEAKANEQIAIKQKKVEERKSKASVVDTAIKERDELKVANSKIKKEAYTTYLSKIDEAKKAYIEVCNTLADQEDSAEKKVEDALKEFCKEYPEGYHSTIKYDDGSTRSYSYRIKEDLPSLTSIFDAFWRW